MSQTHDLQSRLNAAADAKLIKFVDECFSGIGKLGIANNLTDLKRFDSTALYFGDAVNRLKKHAMEKLQEKFRDEETKAFIDRVTHLANSVDELREYVGE
jgi:hypothetical protein